MQDLPVGEVAVRPEPDLLGRRERLPSVERVVRDVADVECARPVGVLDTGSGKALLAGGQAVGFGDVGHLVEMVEAGFGDVERRRHVEDRPPVLDGGDAAGRERAAVADPVDLVQHRHVGVARPHEVGVERVHGPVVVDGARAATSAWPATWPPKIRCRSSSGFTPRKMLTSMGSRSRRSMSALTWCWDISQAWPLGRLGRGRSGV